uniref:Uncharacterized protein n=1 Tax=Kalanchoe fedtschenkoi TaxID=63787 RepID=A0A7N0UXU2_KALFE
MINCMNRNVLERTDSCKLDRVDSPEQHVRLCFLKVERSWSGNLTPPRYEQVKDDGVVGKEVKKKKAHHRRYKSEAGALLGEPKLVRSSGMRRDWSFEDLRDNKTRNVRQ